MKTILIIFAMIFFCSCGSKRADDSSNSDSIIRIDLFSEPKATVTKLSEIAVNTEYIPLQTLEDCLFGPVTQKIINIDNRIYIQNGGKILCFDADGKFLFKIENRGRGPEEYTFISDFDVSFDNKILTILSSSINKLLVYRLADTSFTFQRSVKLKAPAPYRVSMVPNTDKAFLAIPPWKGNEPTLSLLINIVGDTIHFKPNCYKYKLVGNRNYLASNEMLVYSIGNTICFKEEFSDTVFFVDTKDNFFKPRMIFDTHGTLLTPEIRGNPEIPNEHISFIGSIFETSRYVFYSYASKETRNSDHPIVNVFFDKRTKKKSKLDVGFIFETVIDNTVKTTVNKLKDDLGGGPDFTVRIGLWDRYCSGDKLFSFVDAIILKKYVAGEDFKNAKVSDPKKKNELKKLADSLNETDNPVLIIVTPKE